MDATTEFTPWLSLFGGALIGLSAVLLMGLHGRIAGLTGIVRGVLPPVSEGWQWRLAFLAGTALSPLLLLAAGSEIPFAVPISMPALIIGGFIVGIGVTYGNGCPSGHGVCGISRLSARSIVAVVTFMITATITVYVNRHVFGG